MTRLTLAICLLPFEFSEDGKPSPYNLGLPYPPTVSFLTQSPTLGWSIACGL